MEGCSMNEIVQEWIDKAEGDYMTATREAEAIPPNWDAVCFHAQQCVEKMFKALLIAKESTPPKTHDLSVLSRLLHDVLPKWDWPGEKLRLLSMSAVIFRYPGESAGPQEANAALDACKAIRGPLLDLLNEVGI